MSACFNDRMLLSLIQAIHETTLSPGDWTGVVSDIVETIGASGGGLISFEGANENKLNLYLSGLNRAALTRAEHLNALYKECLPLAPGSRIVLSFRRNGNLPYWDALRDCFGDEGEVVLILLAKEARRRVVLLLFFDQGNEKRFASSDDFTMKIVPHMQMAIAMHRLHSRDASRIASLEEAFSNSTAPTAIVTQALQVIHVNARFARLFNAADAQIRLREGALELKDPALSSRLATLMAQARKNGRDNHFTWVKSESFNQSWIISLHRLQSSRDFSNPACTLFPEPETQFLLIVCDLGETLSTPPHTIGLLFGLTPTEADLVFALANGDSPADIARRRGVSKNTVHNQLASAMSRIGVHRQNQLTSLLATVNCLTQ